jgi:hypothetical protein
LESEGFELADITARHAVGVPAVEIVGAEFVIGDD